MLFASLPYEYIKHFDRGDRVRRSRAHTGGSRVRRGAPGTTA